MDINLAQDLSKKFRISIVQIIREEYEMFLLSRIFESVIGKNLIFRGGTALRLAYNSPRFSDDLDFSQISTINLTLFKKWCREATSNNPYLELVEVLKKYYTLFALFRVKDPSLRQGVTIKIEISLRSKKYIKGKDFSLVRLASEVTPLTALAQVATLERIRREKENIIPLRIRDIFDLWFINQKLKNTYNVNFGKFERQEVKRELHRLLSAGSWILIESWLKKE
ncbi:hypothetical protein A3D00_01875 [Candidatus Woesebacteria bacterium RIFCSPHIGHO2_02_FULL_38_9]|uniref:Nucleotidyl transferase AbiEii/AbiGii toxin family protein n=1 Tax=Candidatus Woesebacteria bacterium RIFCSPHIGHO2_01_FULL_39_28 TaxID=1802496 RepID=A0A1F7YIA2_9BACT|nr:MAG: hypothetical protein A2627_02435 [Candidatus Woesebacteria bacterium RIFCSPHIGHO2_01_FULL_39_28]OGM32199.1 MAG: hypothetical protein A3D00_01875 [Candidatus Woesebacteria bacterium RIFCSPHIGHO2_02_FULL_38_9]OGM57185.1 MAG: hypothetical protein A3A50_03295 [Candidatus Woesebacteria bacterium RIFCSPLOWO2_01_FULL_38_20]